MLVRYNSSSPTEGIVDETRGAAKRAVTFRRDGHDEEHLAHATRGRDGSRSPKGYTATLSHLGLTPFQARREQAA